MATMTDNDAPPSYDKVIVNNQLNNKGEECYGPIVPETGRNTRPNTKNFWPRKTDALGVALNMSVLWHMCALLLVPFSPFDMTMDIFLKTGSSAEELVHVDFKTLCSMIWPYVFMTGALLSLVVLLPICDLVDILTPYILIIGNLGVSATMWLLILGNIKLCYCLAIYSIILSIQLAVCLWTCLLVNSLFSFAIIVLLALKCLLPCIPYLTCTVFIHSAFSIGFGIVFWYPGWRNKGYFCVRRFCIGDDSFTWISWQTVIFAITWVWMIPSCVFAIIKSPTFYRSLVIPIWWLGGNCGVYLLTAQWTDLMPSKKFNMAIFSIMWIEWGLGMYVIDMTLIFFVWPAWCICVGFVRVCILDTVPVDNVLFVLTISSLGLAALLA